MVTMTSLSMGDLVLTCNNSSCVTLQALGICFLRDLKGYFFYGSFQSF